MASVLDLPIEKQKELAELEGMPHDAWVKKTKKILLEMDSFREELDANKGIRPDGFTEEDVKRFQAKIDSATHDPEPYKT